MLNPLDYIYLIWLTYLPFSLKAFYHYIVDKDGFESETDGEAPDTSPLIIFQYTTKGEHGKVVSKGIESVTSACTQRHYSRYRIDVVTNGATDSYDANVVRVPEDYVTSNRTLKKARALQYAVEDRRRRGEKGPGVWVWHMDEESVVTEQALTAVLKYVENGAGPVPKDPLCTQTSS